MGRLLLQVQAPLLFPAGECTGGGSVLPLLKSLQIGVSDHKQLPRMDFTLQASSLAKLSGLTHLALYGPICCNSLPVRHKLVCPVRLDRLLARCHRLGCM